MNSLDIGVSVITLLFLGRGIWIGFIRQLASLLAMMLGYFFAGRYNQQLSPLLASVISSPQIRFLLTYALIFLAVFLFITVAGLLLKKVASISMMGWFDRLLGGFFGLFKAALLITVLFMAVSGFLTNASPWLTGSYAAPYLSRSSTFFLSFIKDRELQRQLLPVAPAITPSLPPVPAGETDGTQAKKVRQ